MFGVIELIIGRSAGFCLTQVNDLYVMRVFVVAGAFHPPDWLPEAVGQMLRQRLGLTMFNIDIICPVVETPSANKRSYQVIDINYFPGFDKLDEFERVWVEFLHQQCQLCAAAKSC